jgi:predicted RNA-binding Zn ribbon-like protein
MTYKALPWLIFPPAVDLANTVIATPTGDRDLLANDADLAEWIAAERGRIPGVEAASGRLTEVRDLREAVRTLLHARARGEPVPEEARHRINSSSAAAPVTKMLTADGRATEELGTANAYSRFEASVAVSAIALADPGEERLSVCGAPSCGMLFLRDHPRQVWCSKPCGNRARVARHAARHGRRRAPSAVSGS